MFLRASEICHSKWQWEVAVATAFLGLLFAIRPDVSASAQSSEATLLLQSQNEADRKSTGCLTCHTATDSPTMHLTGTVRLGCTDCHGGESEMRVAAGTTQTSASMRKQE